MRWPRALQVACLALLACAGVPTSLAAASPVACPDCWHPAVGASWQLQLSGTLDTTVPAVVYDVDGFETPASRVQSMRDHGTGTVCYFSAGSYEDWRPDRRRFPRRIIGAKLDGWPGERWLDIRKRAVLRRIMTRRIRLCKRKGFHAIDPDNMDGYTQKSGFHITRRHQIRYNRMIADIAHRHGMSVALKNEGGQVQQLVGWFDFAVVEQCFQYQECALYEAFIAAGKPVFSVEYSRTTDQFCAAAAEKQFSAIRKRLELGVWRETCP